MSLPYQEKNACESGDVVMTVTGEITAVFDPKNFDGKFGPYTLQNGYFLVDGDKLKFSISGEPIPKTLQGHTITFKCSKLPKGGIGGVSYEVSEYDKKDGTHVIEETIKVAKNASILIDGKEYLGGTVTSQPAKAVSSAPQASPSRPVAQSKAITQNETQEAFLTRLTDFHKKCFTAVDETYPGMSNENPVMFQGFVSSIFITADRAGVQNYPCEPTVKRHASSSEEDPEINF